MAEKEIGVVIAYALPDHQWLIDVSVPPGTTVRGAIEASGLLAHAPGIDLDATRVGIYGKLSTLDTVVRASDRIEVYRPLIADPKDARRRRAAGGKSPA
jgi:putative ubiquitin-RnfH superfamily antitoxin RatB of RatAB toxin-antitoxin module